MPTLSISELASGNKVLPLSSLRLGNYWLISKYRRIKRWHKGFMFPKTHKNSIKHYKKCFSFKIVLSSKKSKIQLEIYIIIKQREKKKLKLEQQHNYFVLCSFDVLLAFRPGWKAIQGYFLGAYNFNWFFVFICCWFVNSFWQFWIIRWEMGSFSLPLPPPPSSTLYFSNQLKLNWTEQNNKFSLLLHHQQ